MFKDNLLNCHKLKLIDMFKIWPLAIKGKGICIVSYSIVVMSEELNTEVAEYSG